MDVLTRKLEIKNLFVRCMVDTGSFDNFINCLVEEEETMLEDAGILKADVMKKELKKEIIEELKCKVDGLFDEVEFPSLKDNAEELDLKG